MSSLRTVDLMTVAELVEFSRGTGYVLEFSDRSFSQFFATEIDVDIDDPVYAATGRSKGKRLSRFLQIADKDKALRALEALWEVREAIVLRSGGDDPVTNAKTRYQSVVNRLRGVFDDAQVPRDVPKPAFDQAIVAVLRRDLSQISTFEPQARGYAFEVFLTSLFKAYGLEPCGPFRVQGEQIDGSFILANETYLVEAKWQNSPTGAADLHVFHGKLDQKAAWARGLFISYSGFSEDGLSAWGRAKRVICMDGLDLHETLERGLQLSEVLERKTRRAAETGKAFVRVRELFP